ncbi:MAG: hypothetical protein KGO92_14865, partial [Bacteroidota bacterium]|nr:hypothetical protein [Bacteroidota bacterium]
MRYRLACSLLFLSLFSLAQKKPLDHTVYDSWQSIADRTISRNGQFVAFAVNPQEGDGILFIKTASGKTLLEIPRGYGEEISADSRFLVCKIKARYADTRAARIKKAKTEDLPKDSLAILDLGSGKLEKIARVKSFALPEESGSWLAYLLEKPIAVTKTGIGEPDSATKIRTMLHTADSLLRVSDSLRKKAAEVQATGFPPPNRSQNNKNNPAKTSAEDPIVEGTELVLVQLGGKVKQSYHLVNAYLFDKKGSSLVLETTRKTGSPKTKASIQKIELDHLQSVTVLAGFHDAKQLSLDEAGTQLAFVAERDSSSKA